MHNYRKGMVIYNVNNLTAKSVVYVPEKWVKWDTGLLMFQCKLHHDPDNLAGKMKYLLTRKMFIYALVGRL